MAGGWSTQNVHLHPSAAHSPDLYCPVRLEHASSQVLLSHGGFVNCFDTHVTNLMLSLVASTTTSAKSRDEEKGQSQHDHYLLGEIMHKCVT